MKPINFEETGCSPISSNCVIWQGPDIDCINLCKGDNISTVVYKLAVELCALIDTFDIGSYDLSCFTEVTTAPEDFQELIQFLIERICALEGVEAPGEVTPGGDCPDNCIINICEEFYYMNELGDTITTMPLADYVTAIGNRVCQLIGEITTINATLANHEGRIITLENAVTPDVVLPTVTPTCVLPPVSTEMNVVLSALETQFCELIGATGGPNDIYNAITQQCQGLSGSNQLAGNGAMSSINGWDGTVQNLASAINNIWLTLCDVRAAVANIQINCCDGGCEGIDISLNASLSGTILTLFYTGVIPAGFTEIGASGTVVIITDANGGSTSFNIPLIANLNGTGYTIDLSTTPINEGLNLQIVTNGNFTNGTDTCRGSSTYTYLNSSLCPVIVFTEGIETVNYTFTWINSSGASISVDIYDTTGTTLISTNSHIVTSAGAVTGLFAGLAAGTNYKVILSYTLDGSSVTNTCPQQSVTTLPALCVPPTTVTTTGFIREGEPGYVEP